MARKPMTYSIRKSRLAAFAACLAVSAGHAAAEEAYFKTPSGNIYCAYFDYDTVPEVRCDIQAFTATGAKRPADCDLDWGGAFAIAANSGKGAMLCHGDTVISPDARTLSYGRAFKGGGLTCTSETSGLTCNNARGHGFFLSKAKQKVF